MNFRRPALPTWNVYRKKRSCLRKPTVRFLLLYHKSADSCVISIGHSVPHTTVADPRMGGSQSHLAIKSINRVFLRLQVWVWPLHDVQCFNVGLKATHWHGMTKTPPRLIAHYHTILRKNIFLNSRPWSHSTLDSGTICSAGFIAVVCVLISPCINFIIYIGYIPIHTL